MRSDIDDFCALDFGTSNSILLARDSTGRVRVTREKSLLLFPDDALPNYEVGNRALAVYEECGRRGRLLQSMKSLLPYTSFEGSRIGGAWRTLESLLALIIAYLREAARKQVGRELRKVVLGRPARFSALLAEDRLAEERLQLAAAAAGFEEVRFVLEPVAAAAAYRKTITRPVTALVADLGAGTSDFSVARLEPGSFGNVQSQILANSGVRLGGDDIDGLIMWYKLTGYFGRGTKYKSGDKWLDVPARVFRDLCRWDRLSFLRHSDTRHDLDLFIRRAADPTGLRRLAKLIDRDLGYGVFRSIERAKIELSGECLSNIIFDQEGLEIYEALPAVELSLWLREIEEKIIACVKETLVDASLEINAIESVFLTGGTSLLSPVENIFARMFGRAKIVRGDPFDSVALGLLEMA